MGRCLRGMRLPARHGTQRAMRTAWSADVGAGEEEGKEEFL